MFEGLFILKHGIIFFSFKKNEWFRINEFHMEGRTSDVDISKEIAIIRGVDSHRVIFHSIWKGFYVLKLYQFISK